MIQAKQCQTILIAAFFVIAVIFSITACSKQDHGLTIKDISIYDTVSNKRVYLDMTKAQVEKVLGKPKLVNGNRSDYGDLAVLYKSDVAVNFLLQKVEGSQGRYTFFNNKIRVGDPNGNVVDKLGNGTLALTGTKSDFYINYGYQKKGDTLVKLNQMPQITPNTKEDYYFLTVYLTDVGKNIKSILLIDGGNTLIKK